MTPTQWRSSSFVDKSVFLPIFAHLIATWRTPEGAATPAHIWDLRHCNYPFEYHYPPCSWPVLGVLASRLLSPVTVTNATGQQRPADSGSYFYYWVDNFYDKEWPEVNIQGVPQYRTHFSFAFLSVYIHPKCSSWGSFEKFLCILHFELM